MYIGQQLGQYLITAPLGEGAMGQVFRGRDTQLNRDVAIKVLRLEISSRPDLVDRFRNEAMTLASLHHGNICSVYAFAEHEGRHAMVLQHLEGESLEDVLRSKGKFSWSEVSQILRDVLAGLEEAHTAGIVHRDLKPANLMVTPSKKVVIMDFGIARVKNQQRATREGMMVGTLEYASPEQIRGEDVDARSDLYSLGMIAYELLLGRLPFDAKTDYDWVKAQTQEVPNFLEISQLHGKQVAAFLRKTLEKNPEKRYASAADMKLALEAATTGSKASFPSIRIPSLPTSGTLRGDTAAPALVVTLKENLVLAVSGALVLLGLSFVALTHLDASKPTTLSPSQSLSPSFTPSSNGSPSPAITTNSAPVGASTSSMESARTVPSVPMPPLSSPRMDPPSLSEVTRSTSSSTPSTAAQPPVTAAAPLSAPATRSSPSSASISTGVEVDRPMSIDPLSTPSRPRPVEPSPAVTRTEPEPSSSGWSARSGTKN